MASSNSIYTGAYLLNEEQNQVTTNPIIEKLEAIGLKTLVTHHDFVFPQKVNEFYDLFNYTPRTMKANEGGEWIQCNMNNEYYWFTLQDFGEIMQVPIAGIKFYSNSETMRNDQSSYTGVDKNQVIEYICAEEYAEKAKTKYKIKKEYLKKDLKMLYFVIRENVTCRSSSERASGQPPLNCVTMIEALMLYWIDNGVQFNMAYIMANIMQDAVDSKGTQPWPYGMRITSILRATNSAYGVGISGPKVPLI